MLSITISAIFKSQFRKKKLHVFKQNSKELILIRYLKKAFLMGKKPCLLNSPMLK